MSTILQSAHTNKNDPIALGRFRKESFPGNITAYKTAWSADQRQKFPINSAYDLGISEKAFKAIQILFPYLDKVFRGTGAIYLPQLHSSIANHLNGLQNLCDEVFNSETRSQIPTEMQNQFDKVSKLTRLSLMLHDLPEIPGEVSTFCQRLSKDKYPTETDRGILENKIAEVLIYHALKAAYSGRDSLGKNIHAAISDSQSKTQTEKDFVEQRFHIVNEFAKQLEIDVKESLSDDFNKDYEQLKAAYYMSEGASEFQLQEAGIGNLVKLIDKLESYLHTAIVGNYSLFDMKFCGIFKKDFDKAKEVLNKFGNDILIGPLIRNVFKLFEQSMGIFREWSNLHAPLKPFEKWLD